MIRSPSGRPKELWQRGPWLDAAVRLRLRARPQRDEAVVRRTGPVQRGGQDGRGIHQRGLRPRELGWTAARARSPSCSSTVVAMRERPSRRSRNPESESPQGRCRAVRAAVQAAPVLACSGARGMLAVRMKLALIRRTGSKHGGAELYTGRLLAALVEAGHEVHLFAEDWAELPVGVTWRRVAVTGPRHARPRRFAEAVLRQLDPRAFDCVFSLERTLRQDVYRAGDGVHAAWLAQRRRFAPWWRRPWLGRGAFHREMLALERRTFDPAGTGHIIVNSEMVRADIRARFAFPEARMHLVRNGVLAERFRGGDRVGYRRRLGVGDADLLLLFVGSGWVRKGLRFVLAAMRDPRLAAAGVTLLVLGKGRPPWPRPERVMFGGVAERLADAYAAADVLVFPPIYEPSANVVFEALAAGLPVITSAFNGAGEILSPGETGTVLADPSDVPALVEAVLRWRGRARVAVNPDAISMERNLRETLAVLELAAAERRVGVRKPGL